MNRGKAVFAQLLAQVPFSHFEHLVDVYQANKGIRHFSAWNQFLCLMYAQLTRRCGLRELVACLNAQPSRLYLPVSPQILVHVIETNIFEKITLDQLVNNAFFGDFETETANQLIPL